MIRFTCPVCHKTLKASEKGIGRKIACPKCGQRLLIPAPDLTRNKTVLGKSVSTTPNTASMASARPELAKDEQATGQEPFDCPGCKVPVLVSRESLGRWVECPKCKTGFAAITQDPSISPGMPSQSDNEEAKEDFADTPPSVGIISNAFRLLITGLQLFLFAVAISAVGGAFADFFTPVFPFNGILCIGTALVSLLLLFMFLGFRGQGIGLACFCLLTIAAGFGGWWLLAEYHGGHTRGLLAVRLKPIANVQASVIGSRLLPEQSAPVSELVKDNRPPTESALPIVQGNEKALVKAFLQKHLNDPTGMDIIEWPEPRFVLMDNHQESPLRAGEPISDHYKPGIISFGRIRAKNVFGAFMLSDHIFLIQEGSITKSIELDKSLPTEFAMSVALNQIGHVAAQKITGRVTAVIVQGRVLQTGVVIKDPYSLAFVQPREPDELDKRARISGLKSYASPSNKREAFVSPPHFEIQAVLPGKYSVLVEVHGRTLTFPCVISDKYEIQRFDFDIDTIPK